MKAINKVLASNRKEIKIGNFNVYIFETLEFAKQDKLFQLTDTKNKIQFPFTANVETYNSKEELENKLDEFAKSEGVSKGTTVENQSIKTHSYEVRINNKKEKTIEKYKVVLIEKGNELLTYQYLISTDASYELEKQLFENIINNTF